MSQFEPTIQPPGPAPQHLAEMAAARSAGRKIRRAVVVSQFSGWSIAVFAALTVVFSLSSPPALLLGIGMSIVAFVELRSSSALKRLNLAAPRNLAWNQVGFALLLVAYALWGAFFSSGVTSDISSDPQLKEMFSDLPALETQINELFYGVLIFAALLGPGLTALYYATRSKILRAYLEQTPAWIIDLQRSGTGV